MEKTPASTNLPSPSCTPNQPQYELLHHFLRPNVDPSYPISAVFKLPTELILSILSHITPEPHLTGHYARFRVQYCMQINDDHYQRAQFLRTLSMTCKEMWLRVRPWIWDLIETSRRRRVPLRMMTTIVNGIRADSSLAVCVKYFRTVLCPWSQLIRALQRFMTMRFLWPEAVPAFVKCLRSLPNLHTLEIGSPNYFPCTSQLKKALNGVNGVNSVRLPQMKSLIIPPSAHTLLKHCPNVEEVDWVVGDQPVTCTEFLGSLGSIPDSKIRRLGIPLISPGNPSRK